MDSAEKPNLKRLESEEDEAIARSLAAALCVDDVEKFLQLYDEIPTGISLERLGNIKEMARQLAALTRSPNYSYFGKNHALPTAPLMLNGQFNTPEQSAFKTAEGTPVDQEHFNFDDETLKSLQAVHNFSLSCEKLKLNDSRVSQQECSETVDDDENHCSKNEALQFNDDEKFYTPPASPDESIERPPFGNPLEHGKLITSAVFNLLSQTQTDDSSKADEEGTKKRLKDSKNTNKIDELRKDCFEEYDFERKENQQGGIVSVENCSSTSETSIAVNLERDCLVEKDSLDGSPHSRRSFTQEEDDSGISIVDENDIVQESTMNGGHFEAKKDYEKEKSVEINNTASTQRTYLEKKACNSELGIKYSKSNELNVKVELANQSEIKYTKPNWCDGEDTSIGWQTRQKRMSKKRHDKEFERTGYYNDNNFTDSYKSNHKESTPRRSASRNKDRSKTENKAESYSKMAERYPEDRYKEKNAWTTRRAEDREIHESPRRSGRRGGQAGKKSESKYTKNKEKNSDDKYQNAVQNTKPQQPPTVFSYRDALLKDDSKGTKGQVQTSVLSKTDRTFNLESAVNYLSTVWTSVNNLHKKDPSKVYIYNSE